MSTQYNIPILTIPEPDPLTERVRATWTAGDFGRIALGYERGAAEFIARLGFGFGDRVLDVACGTGNLAIPAAHTGASVTGIDIAPNLIAQASVRAAADNVSVNFDVGDAEKLPYPDDSFDAAVSMFGVMFTARPTHAACELIRVVRPGGRIALASWTSNGFIGQMFKAVARFVPAPAGASSPLLWGADYQVQSWLGEDCTSVEFRRRLMTFEYDASPEDVVNLFRLWYGPTIRAFAALEPWSQNSLQRDLVALWSQHNRATDGTTLVQSEYLEVVAVVGE